MVDVSPYQSTAPHTVMRYERHSVVKLAIVCGPIGRRGSLSPCFTKSRFSWPRSRKLCVYSRLALSSSSSCWSVHVRGTLSLNMPSLRAFSAR
jgi:hypothetical protein